MLFDVNDFDETLPGPVGVGHQAARGQLRGPGPRPRVLRRGPARVVTAGVREYRDRIAQAAGMGGLQAWYEHLEAGELLRMVRKEVAVKRLGKRVARAHEEMVAKARSRDSTRVLAKRAGTVDGELRIVADPPIIVPVEDLGCRARSGSTRHPPSRSCSRRTGAR